jgi:uncharacterized coiled-coil protein SlyX
MELPNHPEVAEWKNPLNLPDTTRHYRTRQCEPDCCPFKDYKCNITGVTKKVVFIADIPLEERHKYIDPEQDINHPCVRVVGHCKKELVNPLETNVLVLETKVKEQADMINTLSSHLTEMTLQINKLTEKLFSLDKVNGKSGTDGSK